MKAYLGLLRDIEENGNDRGDRTGTGTRSVFGRSIRFDLQDGFPLLTTKKIHFKSVVAELLWMLSGESHIAFLLDHGVTIWNEWATKDGRLGPVYGVQWRDFSGPCGGATDQLRELVSNLKVRPFSRRHVVSAWAPGDLPNESLSPQENVNQGKMALAPCHFAFQCYVGNSRVHDRDEETKKWTPRRKLSLQMHMRSTDAFLGLPFNIASYALLTHLLAHQTDMEVGELIITFGDLHLYQNHRTPEILGEQLSREPRQLPQLRLLRHPESLFDYRVEDIKVVDYLPHPTIKAEISI